ncbi:glycosyl-transferase for dystroglycan-domain-containing protein [Roridomyces roridus]|uniref:Glycosyl-transferase for dystroglycan-domain-containing protein n=1 Tax=Roridomyces roridus TaxID=1738132 RepID=A0AAD7G0C9_9AGAR|nr:glycosyl-transferase for dystroglycan-domain-containing protein [Roridomyces roridus]
MILRVLKSLLGLYLVAAVLYTSNQLILAPLNSAISSLLPPTTSFNALRLLQPRATPPEFEQYVLADSHSSSDNVIHWTSSDFALRNGLGHENPISMPEDLFLSKLFATSMRPSKIVPFFYRATGSFDQEDITITTLVTSSRFQVLARLVERYPGPISVTVHVKNTTNEVRELLDTLHMLYLSSPKMASNVDVHLVIDAFDRQFNTWRNIARFFARTDFVMMLDIDFSPCTDFRTAIRNSKEVMDKLRTGTAALVVPAFEYPVYADGTDESKFPRSKAALVSLVRAGKIGVFHASWVPGHSSTDYERYYGAAPGEVYKVTTYQSAYEPYVIFKKDGPPWCDERFVGYGGNKAACLFEMYLSGISYYVLSDHFLVHQNHLYEETARRIERKYNRKLYAEFKEEACFRYLKRFHSSGLLNTTRGMNVQGECKKIRGIGRILADVGDW